MPGLPRENAQKRIAFGAVNALGLQNNETYASELVGVLDVAHCDAHDDVSVLAVLAYFIHDAFKHPATNQKAPQLEQWSRRL